MATFEIKQGDSSPVFVGRCLDARGRSVPTLGAAVRFRMRPQVDGLRDPIDRVAFWSDPDRAEAAYAWALDGSDTDTPGLYDAEFHVTFGDGSTETFPAGEYVTVEVLPSATGGLGGSGLGPQPNLAAVLANGNSANAYRITDLAAPVADLDAATKAYVDANVGGGSPSPHWTIDADGNLTITPTGGAGHLTVKNNAGQPILQVLDDGEVQFGADGLNRIQWVAGIGASLLFTQLDTFGPALADFWDDSFNARVVILHDDHTIKLYGRGGGLAFRVGSAAEVFLEALPGSDPHVVSQLWNNGGSLMVSAG